MGVMKGIHMGIGMETSELNSLPFLILCNFS